MDGGLVALDKLFECGGIALAGPGHQFDVVPGVHVEIRHAAWPRGWSGRAGLTGRL
jgi:hypothetical protein